MNKSRSELASLQNQMCQVPGSCIQLARVTATLAQGAGYLVTVNSLVIGVIQPTIHDRHRGLAAGIAPGTRPSRATTQAAPTPLNMERVIEPLFNLWFTQAISYLNFSGNTLKNFEAPGFERYTS
jgi:hypothetical protein